jgi:multiple antibiotic resistance protein
MLPDLALFVTQFATLWIMLDPLGHLPLFLDATQSMTPGERRRTAILGPIFAFLVLLFFGIVGQHLLEAMGVSLLSFQISGGVILLLYAITLVLGEHKTSLPQGVVGESQSPINTAVYPVAMPILAGPGSLLTIVLLMDNHRFSFAQQLGTLTALAAVLFGVMIVFVLGDYVIRVVRTAGINIARRIMGTILAAVAINLIVSALAKWLDLNPI